MNGIITEIKPSECDPNSRDVFVDHSLATTLTAAAIVELQLMIDQPWSGATEERIASHVASIDARCMALDLLSRRKWGISELSTRLVKRGVEKEIAKHTTTQLAEDGWLDDLAYARALIRQWIGKEPAGRRWLQHKLREKELPVNIASKAIEAERNNQSEQDAATTLATLRLAKVSNVDEGTATRRVRAALGRKGFDSEVTMEAIRRARKTDA
jgi:regulatory protein